MRAVAKDVKGVKKARIKRLLRSKRFRREYGLLLVRKGSHPRKSPLMNSYSKFLFLGGLKMYRWYASHGVARKSDDTDEWLWNRTELDLQGKRRKRNEREFRAAVQSVELAIQGARLYLAQEQRLMTIYFDKFRCFHKLLPASMSL